MRFIAPERLDYVKTRQPISDDHAQVLLRRAQALATHDRLLVELICRNASRRHVARLLNASAGTVCRRFNRLAKRLCDPLVVTLMESSCPLRPDYRKIGLDHFLLGKSARQIARENQLTTHEIGQALSYLRGWHRGIVEGARWRDQVTKTPA